MRTVRRSFVDWARDECSCKIISPLPGRPFHLFSREPSGSVLHSNHWIFLLAHPLLGVHVQRFSRAHASAGFRFLSSLLHPSAIKRCGTVCLG